jgi:ankyrin repeat protein
VDFQEVEIVKELLKAHMNVNYQEPKLGWSALHIAAIHGDLRIIKLLVGRGADVGICDFQMKTPYMYAEENHCIDATSFLGKISSKKKIPENK